MTDQEKYEHFLGVLERGQHYFAVKGFESLAEAGHVPSMLKAGEILLNGDGGIKDTARAKVYFERAADKGDVEASFKLGWMFDNGVGVERDYTSAAKWYEKAAIQGHKEAKLFLEDLQEEGLIDKSKNPKNIEVKKHTIATDDEIEADIEEYYEEGNDFFYGRNGVEVDFEAAFECFEMAANLGHPDAQNFLGWMYQNGKGVEADDKKSFDWYLKAANLGNKYAESNLGYMYENGKGVSKNGAEALKWYLSAAKKGNSTAQNTLGIFYDRGENVEQNYFKALDWYEKAAESGNKFSFYNIGLLYQYGKGVKKDLDQAKRYYQLSLEHGYEKAQEKLTELKENKSPMQKEPPKKYDAASNANINAVLQQLRLKLLDLSGNNRLINFRHTIGKSLQFTEGSIYGAYQKLVESSTKSSFQILGLPEPKKNDLVSVNGRLQRPDPKEWAKSNEINVSFDLENQSEDKSLRALMYSDDLAKHCRKIEREALLAIEETGANMLFLVLGFLEFPDQKDSDKIFTAPLVSIPVALVKKEVAGIQSFSLSFTGDEISENISLREKLKNDYGITIPDLDVEDFDIQAYLEEIAEAVQELPRFNVKHSISLCLLSFTNMLLVQDLDPDNWDLGDEENSLLAHEIVREVLEGATNGEAASDAIFEDYRVEEGDADKIPLIYDADSSQHSALVDVLNHKKNTVIIGPPGTGKSQTITNLIAAGISAGKKILFVAEKMAALEVVKNRLTKAGLEPFVLELHSNKTNKKRVLEEINRRIKFQAAPPEDLPALLNQLQSDRKNLKAYSDSINSICYNSLSLTLHDVIWRSEKYRSLLTTDESRLSDFMISDATEIVEETLVSRMNCLSHLSNQFSIIKTFDKTSAFWGFYPKHILPGDEHKIREVFSESVVVAKNLIEDIALLEDVSGSICRDLNSDIADKHSKALEDLKENANAALPLTLLNSIFGDDLTGNKSRTVLEQIKTQIDEYSNLGPTVEVALEKSTETSNEVIQQLQNLKYLSDSLGVRLGPIDSFNELRDQIRNAVELLTSSVNLIDAFANSKKIKFDKTRENLSQLKTLSLLVNEAPEDYFHLQRPALGLNGAVDAIRKLSLLQSKWLAIQTRLSEKLYLDMLPSEQLIKESIITLREGDRWFRIFQSKWRSAISTHRSLQIDKSKVSSQTRLADLEELSELIEQKAKWKKSPTWDQFIGIEPQADPEDLSGYLTLAEWNTQLQDLLEELNIDAIDTTNLKSSDLKLMKREYAPLTSQINLAQQAIDLIDSKFERINEFAKINLLETTVSKAELFILELNLSLGWLNQNAKPHSELSEVISSAQAVAKRVEIKESIQQNKEAQVILGQSLNGVDTDIETARQVLDFGLVVEDLPIPSSYKNAIRNGDPLEVSDQLQRVLTKISINLNEIDKFSQTLATYGEFDIKAWVDSDQDAVDSEYLNAFVKKTSNAIDHFDLLIPWSQYIARREEADKLGLLGFINFLERNSVPSSELADTYAYCTYSTIMKAAFRNLPGLSSFSGLKQNQIREEFQRLDNKIISLRGRSIGALASKHNFTVSGKNGARVDDKTEMALLNYLAPQQRPRMPVRKMILRAGQSIQALKPCFMMGPQAVAQYLAPDSIKFDLVIMDEASQLRPEEAIGAIARGGQLVVVGDPNQLPPTSFFSRSDGAGNQFASVDSESILDVCRANFKVSRLLKWHYRSQHHSLIAFSNRNFYRDDLVVFPSPYGQSSNLGVRAIYLADAIYENQINLREARRVVDSIVEHILKRPGDSLGVVTLNIKQRDLISELMDERLMSLKEADAYRDYWIAKGEPIFIKNLENVQGDERDAIIISTTFGKPEGANVVRQNFGPISRQGGWRRLNVLFTRAKKSIAVITSLRPEDIVDDSTTPEGTRALRHYLEYARSGSLSVSEITGQDPDSDFEISVMDMLKSNGYEVIPQLGVAKYRIDIAVKHPDMPGTFLAAIECDGASYHSALSVRDRDRIRQEILESLGWKGRIWRIWSTDWFRTPRSESAKLLSFLNDLRQNWKPEHASGESWIEEGESVSVDPEKSKPSEVVQSSESSNTEQETIDLVLIDDDEYIEVELNDVVKYVDIVNPDDVLTAQIVSSDEKDDTKNGIVSEVRPLGAILLGSQVGDEVHLHLPAAVSRTFRILEIIKANK